MGGIKNVRQILESMCDLFAECAIECVDAMFGKESELKMPWQVVEQLQAQFDRLLTMGSGNEEFSALTCAGIQYDSLDAFVEEENISTEYAADILGEFVNNYCGLLSSKDVFKDNFGQHIQAVPILYSDGQSFLPFIWGVQGYIYIGDHWMYIGYTIRDNITRSNNKF